MNIVRKNPWIAATILFGGYFAFQMVQYILRVIQVANETVINAMISSASLAALVVIAAIAFYLVILPQVRTSAPVRNNGNNRNNGNS